MLGRRRGFQPAAHCQAWCEGRRLAVPQLDSCTAPHCDRTCTSDHTHCLTLPYPTSTCPPTGRKQLQHLLEHKDQQRQAGPSPLHLGAPRDMGQHGERTRGASRGLMEGEARGKEGRREGEGSRRERGGRVRVPASGCPRSHSVCQRGSHAPLPVVFPAGRCSSAVRPPRACITAEAYCTAPPPRAWQKCVLVRRAL